MHLIVDLPAVRAGRLAAALTDDTLDEPVRSLRPYLRGARSTSLPDGVRIALELDSLGIAALADEVRALANAWPFFTFRLLADPPACALEVTGTGPAAEMARAVFAELGAS
jgi:hypothetical protein